MHRFPGASRLAAACACLGLLAACATGASPEQMVLSPGTAPTVSTTQAGYQALRVGLINGGSPTNPAWLSQVSDADFAAALTASLRNMGYLAPDEAASRYVVRASIVDLQTPSGAMDPVLILAPLDWAATIKVRYTVTPAGGGAAVFDEVVAATGTGRGGEAATSAGRVKKAVEAAVRADIETFATRLQAEWK